MPLLKIYSCLNNVLKKLFKEKEYITILNSYCMVYLTQSSTEIKHVCQTIALFYFIFHLWIYII